MAVGKNNIEFSSKQEIIKNEKVLSEFHQVINHYNQNFGGWEQLKKFELVADEWTPESGLLTPTLKLKRKIIAKKYEGLINKIYVG